MIKNMFVFPLLHLVRASSSTPLKALHLLGSGIGGRLGGGRLVLIVVITLGINLLQELLHHFFREFTVRDELLNLLVA